MKKKHFMILLILLLSVSLFTVACSDKAKESPESEMEGEQVEPTDEKFEAVNLHNDEQGDFTFEGSTLVFTPHEAESNPIEIPLDETSEFKKHEGETSYQLIIVTDGTEEHEFSGLDEEFFKELEKYK